MEKSKIRPLIGLLLVYLAFFLNWYWLWGLLFLIWVIPDIFTGTTYFMEKVDRKSNPFLYWLIVVSWIGMSVFMITMSIYPELAN